ncbi:EamA domain-containing membrane protein RarD [Pasteurella testudinis DSM 23072]|uniref:EamA domain-containing membrane protein RarD n=1 Tax=Pasteurella testudinis DSM 23072 TaxID=1122938 RepID=A0A1W1VAU1_9PAST|nr:DMT family transporter [Pasteurella testudinis]SMB90539.1 EamA domain-containing membrane protein RarD [Pasteurella testudinis DSM 23072]SUB52819.1 drug/metabolite transporter [Pasteurella testudinis]
MKQTIRPVSGFLFALATAICWGTVPLALKPIVQIIDSSTIVWYRFAVAAIGLLVILTLLDKLPHAKLLLSPRFRWLTVIGIFALGGNFLLFNTSLTYLDPAVTQVIAQVSPFLMMVASAVFLKELIGPTQKIGAVLLIIGLLLFFNERLAELFTSMTAYTKGVLLSLSAALVWVGYGLAQKLMLRRFNSQQILLIFYAGSALLFTPLATPSDVTKLPWFELFCLAYCCLNTLVAYGSYAEAINRWDVSKVSAIITLTPLFTILFSEIAHWVAPNVFALPDLNLLSYIGACVVVAGALCSAIGHKFLFRHKN